MFLKLVKNPTNSFVGVCQSDYETYSDALEAGLHEALTMLETKTIDVIEERNINIKNGVYIENNTGIINI